MPPARMPAAVVPAAVVPAAVVPAAVVPAAVVPSAVVSAAVVSSAVVSAAVVPAARMQAASAIAGQPELPARKRVLRITKYERTKLIGIRAEQLVRDAQAFVDVDPGRRFDPFEIAERELMARRLPFVVVRQMPDGKTEHVKLDDVDLEL